MNNLFSEYEPVVVIGESSIHNMFFQAQFDRGHNK